MELEEVVKLQENHYEDPVLTIDFYNLGRGFMKSKNNDTPTISSKVVLVWRIVEDQLQPVDCDGIFFNYETYLVQWTLEYSPVPFQLKEQTIFFYWKGANASKGLCPIPEDFDTDIAIVNRIVEWSESPIFFHIFPKPVVFLNERFSQFDTNSKHMFIVLGELSNEIHLRELPFHKKNLRSRGVFLIVLPEEQVIYVWKGLKSIFDIENFHITSALKAFEKSWTNFNIKLIMEREEDKLFPGDTESYFHIKVDCDFTPRLFYLNSITGDFLATEIEYPLRRKAHTAAFPFLQSHLTTSDDPGLFLLDNNHEIWLISSNEKRDVELYDFGIKTAKNYAKSKEKYLKKSVPVKTVESTTNLIEFTNIFPYWK